MIDNIESLEQLEKEKEKLEMMMKVTKDALAQSLGTNRKQLKDFLLKKVAIPAGAIGIGAYAANKIVSSNQNTKKEKKNALATAGFWSTVAPLAMNFVQTFYLQKQNKEMEENQQEISKVLQEVS